MRALKVAEAVQNRLAADAAVRQAQAAVTQDQAGQQQADAGLAGATPPEIVVGIPADLIRRRPDLRSAERLIAAQNAQIGVAEADWYPSFFISGSLGYAAKDFGHLFA